MILTPKTICEQYDAETLCRHIGDNALLKTMVCHLYTYVQCHPYKTFFVVILIAILIYLIIKVNKK